MDNIMTEKTYRYSEIFYSFQGEAVLAGKPTVWLRFFGCNLECNGFGQEHPTRPETHILPYQDFDANSVQRLEDLPVWKYGCDSSYSWSTKYKHLVHNDTAEDIVDKLTALMTSPTNPEGLFIHPVTNQDTQLAFTGGEPMLNQKAMIAILDEFTRRGNCPMTVTVETNATKPITKELKEYFVDCPVYHWHWAMSPKLYNVSGEKDVVIPDQIYEYCDMEATAVLKFVHDGSAASWEEMDKHLYQIQQKFASRPLPSIWIMPVGATKDQQEAKTVGEISIDAMKRGYNIATRNHCYVFGNVIGK
jgi:6-pyruvoyltetrahydropterin 2'-reductase